MSEEITNREKDLTKQLRTNKKISLSNQINKLVSLSATQGNSEEIEVLFDKIQICYEEVCKFNDSLKNLETSDEELKKFDIWNTQITAELKKCEDLRSNYSELKSSETMQNSITIQEEALKSKQSSRHRIIENRMEQIKKLISEKASVAKIKVLTEKLNSVFNESKLLFQLNQDLSTLTP